MTDQRDSKKGTGESKTDVLAHAVRATKLASASAPLTAALAGGLPVGAVFLAAVPAIGSVLCEILLAVRAQPERDARERKLAADIRQEAERCGLSEAEMAEKLRELVEPFWYVAENFYQAIDTERVAFLGQAAARLLTLKAPRGEADLLARVVTMISPVEVAVLLAGDRVKGTGTRGGSPIQAFQILNTTLYPELPKLDTGTIDAALSSLVGRGLLGLAAPDTETGRHALVAVTRLSERLVLLLKAETPA